MAVRRIRGARETPLFSALSPDPGGERIVAGTDDFVLFRGWLAPERADALLAAIRAETVWLRERRKMYDRVVDVPREQAWVGEGPASSRPWTPELAEVRDALERLAGVRFRYVLLNRYRDGADSVAWHNDRDVAGIDRPAIGSLTLGATRAFDVRRKDDRARVVSVDLDHGDLVLMRGAAQVDFEHRVAKDRRVSGERVNLTFREYAERGSFPRIEQEFDAAGGRKELR
jgi:alkylated DNA repair dioxygenase AlkB